MGVLDGSDVRVNLQWESSYGTLDTNASPFVPGSSGTLETAEAVNNITRITNFASDTAVALKEAGFDGAFSLSFGLSSPWYLQSVYGPPDTTDNGDGSYTHTYDPADRDPTPFQILEGYETSTTAERALEGSITGRIAIQPSVDDEGETRVTMEGFYRKESLDTNVTLTSQSDYDGDVLDYADAELKRDGAAEAIMQDASLELAWEVSEGIDAFGTRFPVDFITGLFAPTLSYSKIKQDADALQDVYGGASATTVQESIDNTVSAELRFDNDKAAGSGVNRHVYSLSGTAPDRYGEDGPGDPAAAIAENLERIVTDATIDVTNETASAP